MPIIVTRESRLLKTENTKYSSLDQAKQAFDVLVKDANGINDGVKRTHKIVVTPDDAGTFDGTVPASATVNP